jgi:plasmid stabilization system protein ParE
MKVRYVRGAIGDLDAIYNYLETAAPAAANSVKELIERRIAELADFPLMAPASVVPGVRELTVLRYPYKVITRLSTRKRGFFTFAMPAAAHGAVNRQQ